jgi:hypothetical protein
MNRIFRITRIDLFVAVDDAIEARVGSEVQEKADFEVC